MKFLTFFRPLSKITQGHFLLIFSCRSQVRQHFFEKSNLLSRTTKMTIWPFLGCFRKFDFETDNCDNFGLGPSIDCFWNQLVDIHIAQNFLDFFGPFCQKLDCLILLPYEIFDIFLSISKNCPKRFFVDSDLLKLFSVTFFRKFQPIFRNHQNEMANFGIF